MSKLKLNDVQCQAVQAPLGVYLVLAGAGSGKTQVLVQRIGFLINELKAHPNQILAVTFTNKAAVEMKERISALLSYDASSMWIGTFHGLANRILRRHHSNAGLGANFQILDSSDQRRLLKAVISELNISEKDIPATSAASFINRHKDNGIRAHNLQLSELDFHNKQLHKIYVEYEKACKRSDVIDFAEILLRSLELLRNNKEILRYYQQRFQHILVDEFQDTNSVQYAWLQMLASKQQSLMVVGDDDQSIYGWRGAKIENIQNFHLDFPSCTTIRLEQNYRSTTTILQAANAVIANNLHARLGKDLWTAQNGGDKINLYRVNDEVGEARNVVDEILAAQKKGVKLQDIAVLYRTNAQSRALEDAFIRKDVNYRIYGDMSFYARAEIKNAMAYLAVISNPHNNAALGRIINFPPRTIGPKTTSVINQIARENEVSLWDATLTVAANNELTARAQRALVGFIDLITDLQHQASSLTLAQLMDLMLNDKTSGLLKYYREHNDFDSSERVKNLEELITAAETFENNLQENNADFDPNNHLLTLQNFIDQNALVTEEEDPLNEQNHVSLMTVHKAKGLEFDYVIITGLEEEIFPIIRPDEDDGLAEERRLFYVALTRARKMISLYYADSRRVYGRMEKYMISRFVREIPKELINSKDKRPSALNSNKFRSFSLNPKPKANKLQDYIDKAAEKFRLGQSIYHEDYGDGLVLKKDGNKIEVVIMSTNSRYWLNEDDPKLKGL